MAAPVDHRRPTSGFMLGAIALILTVRTVRCSPSERDSGTDGTTLASYDHERTQESQRERGANGSSGSSKSSVEHLGTSGSHSAKNSHCPSTGFSPVSGRPRPV
jgi:hypothetical protein